MLQPTPDRPRKTLTSLPKEVLTLIALHLDRPSALSYALVCRATVQPADYRIWRDIDVFLPKQFGELPLVQPYSRTAGWKHCSWAKQKASEAEERRCLGLRDKVRTIIMRADERRWGMVEEVTIVPRKHANPFIAALLEYTTPHLKRLVLRAPERHVLIDSHTETRLDNLFFDIATLHNAKATFACLTEVVLGEHIIHCWDALKLLVVMAPSLKRLQVDLSCVAESDADSDDSEEDNEGDSEVHDALKSETRLPNRPNLTLPDTTNLVSISFEIDEHFGVDGFCNPFVLRLLRISSQLAELELDLHDAFDDYEGETVGEILTHVKHHRHLRSLRLPWVGLRQFRGNIVEGDFPALEYLELTVWEQTDHEPVSFLEWPALPCLKGVLIAPLNPSQRSSPLPSAAHYTSRTFPEIPFSAGMTPGAASGLRACPRLEYVLYDYQDPFPAKSLAEIFEELDRDPMVSPWEGGRIRSLTHCGDELLQIRSIDHYQLACDVSATARRPSSQHDQEEKEYEDKDGKPRILRFDITEDWSATEATDFDGLRVPPEIIRNMRIAAGVNLAAWQGRNVEVGDKAWKVLTDWRKTVMQEPGILGKQTKIVSTKKKSAGKSKSKAATSASSDAMPHSGPDDGSVDRGSTDSGEMINLSGPGSDDCDSIDSDKEGPGRISSEES